MRMACCSTVHMGRGGGGGRNAAGKVVLAMIVELESIMFARSSSPFFRVLLVVGVEGVGVY